MFVRVDQQRLPGDNGSHVDPDVQARVLEALGSAGNYRAWLCELASPYLGARPLEVGSGLGAYAQEWLDNGQRAITVSERDPALLARLGNRFAADERVTVLALDLAEPPSGSYSSLVAYNVLEHVADDRRALRAAHRLLAPGGCVVVFVPAVPVAMSRFDRRIGHVRRYTRASLSAAFAAAGLPVVRMDYVNAPGLVAWFLGMRLLRMTPRDGAILRAWDRLVVPATRLLESRIRPPIGQSLFAVARVPNPSSRR